MGMKKSKCKKHWAICLMSLLMAVVLGLNAISFAAYAAGTDDGFDQETEETITVTTKTETETKRETEAETDPVPVSPAESYLTSIQGLDAEVSACDGTQDAYADIYNRLMDVYTQAYDDYEGEKLTEEEFEKIDEAIGEAIASLQNAGYNPYAVALLPDNPMTGDSDPEDVTYINVQKTFTGIDASQIPNGFSITVKDSTGTVVSTLRPGDSNCTASSNGLILNWKVDGLAAGTYTVEESGQEIENYEVVTTGLGTVTTRTANINFNLVKEEPSCNQNDWTIGSQKFIVAALTGGKGCFVWTDVALSANQRVAVKQFIAQRLGGNYKTDPLYFYSGDRIADADGLLFKGGRIKYVQETGSLHFSDTSQWSKFAYGAYTLDGAENPEIEVTNAYTPMVTDVTISKTVTGNMGDIQKEFNFEAVLTDAKGQPIIPTAPADGSYRVDAEGKITFTNIPYGVTYTVVEDSYTGDRYDAAVYNFSDSNKTIDSANDTVAITNNKQADVDTGVFLDNMPYVVMLVLVAAAAVVFITKKRYN